MDDLKRLIAGVGEALANTSHGDIDQLVESYHALLDAIDAVLQRDDLDVQQERQFRHLATKVKSRIQAAHGRKTSQLAEPAAPRRRKQK